MYKVDKKLMVEVKVVKGQEKPEPFDTIRWVKEDLGFTLDQLQGLQAQNTFNGITYIKFVSELVIEKLFEKFGEEQYIKKFLFRCY